MARYIVKRIAQGLLLVFVVSILVFSMLHMMPGDPIELMVDRKVSQEKKDEMRAQYGLDLPLPVQYVNWVNNILHGNFGTSIRTRMPVSQLLRAHSGDGGAVRHCAAIGAFDCAAHRFAGGVQKGRLF
ncbi:MAG: ABC transporter permease [Clostridia bacterium]|nr:ABC transporter permease [Clostridia bacterium]